MALRGRSVALRGRSVAVRGDTRSNEWVGVALHARGVAIITKDVVKRPRVNNETEFLSHYELKINCIFVNT